MVKLLLENTLEELDHLNQILLPTIDIELLFPVKALLK
jgi:hypothetical protein